MFMHNQLWHTKFAALLLLFILDAETNRQSMDAWREHEARSLGCCTRIDDVRVAAPVDLSELRGTGAAPEGIIAPSPSHECLMHIRVRRARLGAMYVRDGRMGGGLLVDLDVQVKGPSPQCDGSFAHIKVWDSSDGVKYRSAFSYWGGWLNITTVEHAASAPPDQGGGERNKGGGERSRHNTIVLPAEGAYWLEVLYDSEGYTGFLDRNEGLKLSSAERDMLQPARTVFDPWLVVPASCFNKTIPASSPGCDCDDGRRRHMYQSWPGYWAENRTLYVPLFHPRVTSWATRLLAGDDGLLASGDGVHEQRPESAALDLMLGRVPGGLSILGTSRTRTLHYDILGMLGFRGMFNHTKEGVSATLGWTRANTGTRIDFNSHHYKPIEFGFERNESSDFHGKRRPSHDGLQEMSGTLEYADHLLASMDRANLCTKTSMRSVVVYSEGAHPAAKALGPRGLAGSVSLVNKTLSILAHRCSGTKTTLMVASEMACHDHWAPNGNSFRDNRIVGFNAATQEIARELELPFIDVYPMSLSADVSPPYLHPVLDGFYSDDHHYWSTFHIGDEVSVSTASAYMEAVSNALDADSDLDHLACTFNIIEPFDGQRMQLQRYHPGGCTTGRAGSGQNIEEMDRESGMMHGDLEGGRCGLLTRNRRNISVIIAASAACVGLGGNAASFAISVDGMMMPAEEQRLFTTEGGASDSVVVSAVVELGEGPHTVSAACAVPGFQAEEVSRFELEPYAWHGNRTRPAEGARAIDLGRDSVGGDEDLRVADQMIHHDTRRLAIVLCNPPRVHTECIIHGQRLMESGAVPYDIMVLSDDCGWFKDYDGSSRILQWRFRERHRSSHLGGMDLSCTELPFGTVGPRDAWGTWLGARVLNPETLGLGRYQSLVLMSPDGVESLMRFSLDRVRNSMRHAGAHVAMPSLLYHEGDDDKDTDNDIAAGSGGRVLHEHRQDFDHCVRWTAGNSLRNDPPVLVLTASAWQCAWTTLREHGETLILPHLSSVLCSPRGALSACDMGQACILADHSPVEVMRSVYDSFDSGKGALNMSSSSSHSLEEMSLRPYPYGFKRTGPLDDCEHPWLARH